MQQRNLKLIGRYSDGNYYWDLGGSHMTVFRPNGILFEFFQYNEDLSDSTPAVSPSGDIYFMHYGEDKVTLYKIERQW